VAPGRLRRQSFVVHLVGTTRASCHFRWDFDSANANHDDAVDDVDDTDAPCARRPVQSSRRRKLRHRLNAMEMTLLLIMLRILLILLHVRRHVVVLLLLLILNVMLLLLRRMLVIYDASGLINIGSVLWLLLMLLMMIIIILLLMMIMVVTRARCGEDVRRFDRQTSLLHF